MADDTQIIRWEEVEGASKKMFTVWVDGAELEWAKEAWSHLTAAGLASAITILDVTATHLRLVTLARIADGRSHRDPHIGFSPGRSLGGSLEEEKGQVRSWLLVHGKRSTKPG